MHGLILDIIIALVLTWGLFSFKEINYLTQQFCFWYTSKRTQSNICEPNVDSSIIHNSQSNGDNPNVKWINKIFSIHTMECSALKREGNSDNATILQCKWNLMILYKWKKLDTKRQILHNSTYMKYTEQSNSWRHKVEWW